jgi:DNA-binding transcriptional ArsR family regulator
MHIQQSSEVQMDMPLEEKMRRIERKLEKIEADINEMRSWMLESTKLNDRPLFSLPSHLRKTAIGLMKVGLGTASDVSKLTGRARAVESGYLNQLERQGFVRSFRDGRRKIFSLPEPREVG